MTSKALRDKKVIFMRKGECKLQCTFSNLVFDIEWAPGGGGSFLKFVLTGGDTKQFEKVYAEINNKLD